MRRLRSLVACVLSCGLASCMGGALLALLSAPAPECCAGEQGIDRCCLAAAANPSPAGAHAVLAAGGPSGVIVPPASAQAVLERSRPRPVARSHVPAFARPPPAPAS